jgi:F0F1-type ATP synthase assembly protein I
MKLKFITVLVLWVIVFAGIIPVHALPLVLAVLILDQL